MTDSLDQITATLNRVAEQQKTNTEGIEDLLGAVATTQASVDKTNESVSTLGTDVKHNKKLFETLRSEANADRKETRRLFNDAINQMEANRAESGKRFNEALDRIDAQQEVIQRLLVELINTNRDATKLRDRVDSLEQAG